MNNNKGKRVRGIRDYRDNLVLDYYIGENLTGDIIDHSGHNNNGTIVGATRVQGYGDLSGRKTDAIDDLIQIPGLDIYNLGKYSLEFLLKADDNIDDRYFYCQGNSTTNTPLFGLDYKDYLSDWQVRLFIRGDDNVTIKARTGNTVLKHNKFYHIIFTDDNGDAKIYFNTVQDSADFSYTRRALTIDQTAIGALWRTSVSNNFGGVHSLFRVYDNEIFTQEQINNRYLYIKKRAGIL